MPEEAYQNRNRIKRLWARFKEWRTVTTSYDKNTRLLAGILCLDGVLD
ncbi:MAG: hypothetical protein INR71_01000 [Terriglobus roseus]|nr:hypothetical protein [Terriglobus roseus]